MRLKRTILVLFIMIFTLILIGCRGKLLGLGNRNYIELESGKVIKSIEVSWRNGGKGASGDLFIGEAGTLFLFGIYVISNDIGISTCDVLSNTSGEHNLACFKSIGLRNMEIMSIRND